MNVALSWSGGKDSALALRALREESDTEPVALLTTVTEDYGRVSMHGVRRELVRAQAEAAGVPLVEVGIPAACPNAVYEAKMTEALSAPPLDEVGEMAFADLFLEEIRPTAWSGSQSGGKRGSFRSGAVTPAFWPVSSSTPASRPCSSASIRASSIPRSSAGHLTTRFSPTSRPASTPAARTASSTPSFTRARSTTPRSRSSCGETALRDGFAFQDLVRPASPPGDDTEMRDSSDQVRSAAINLRP